MSERYRCAMCDEWVQNSVRLDHEIACDEITRQANTKAVTELAAAMYDSLPEHARTNVLRKVFTYADYNARDLKSDYFQELHWFANAALKYFEQRAGEGEG